MIDKYQETAIASGARIISFCGHDCVPWDLSLLKCSKTLQKKGEELNEVSIYTEVNGEPSGGTVQSMEYILFDK
jgi:short subunit dehydrogenase-like uncharacterized protein